MVMWMSMNNRVLLMLSSHIISNVEQAVDRDTGRRRELSKPVVPVGQALATCGWLTHATGDWIPLNQFEGNTGLGQTKDEPRMAIRKS
jgi:hypothetical protein